MMDEISAESEFLRLIEQHEQRVLDLVSQAVDETHYIRCSSCGSSCEVPFYRQKVMCTECRPSEITLEENTLDKLLEEAREDLFEEISLLDSEFSKQENIQLRDTVLHELVEASLLAEASANAKEALLDRVDENSFDDREFDNLIKDLLRVRLASRFAKIFGIPESAIQEILKHRIESLFVKQKKTINVGDTR